MHINIQTDFEDYQLELSANSYRNLMYLIKDNVYVAGFGECGGMGRCGTCMIEILSNHKALESFDRNEEATLRKMGIISVNTRLSCQMLITEALDGIEIKIAAP